MQYIFNKETQKLELEFTKEAYMAMPDSTKKEIKSMFLFSGSCGCWVCRSLGRGQWNIDRLKKLGFEDGGEIGERLSYAEELEVKAEKAEARAERYSKYAENADMRNESLQAEFNQCRKDWSWLTQPILAGHAGSQAFARSKQRIIDKYDRGIEEWRKARYFRERAATAQDTAENGKLSDPIYLHNQIKQCKKDVNILQGNIVRAEEKLIEMEKGIDGTEFNINRYEKYINDCIEKVEYLLDKQYFMEDKMAELPGQKFSADNIKPGYIVHCTKWGKVTVGTCGKMYFVPENFGYLCKLPYESITEIYESTEREKLKNTIVNPYKVGQLLGHYYTGKTLRDAFEIVGVTDQSVRLQEVQTNDDGSYDITIKKGKPFTRRVTKSHYNDSVGVYHEEWQLYVVEGV